MKKLFDFLQGKNCELNLSLKVFQKVAVTMMSLVHVYFLILFFIHKVPFLVGINLLNIFCLILTYKLADKEYHILHYKIVFFDIMIHMICIMVIVGDNLGFCLYGIGLIPVNYCYFYLFSMNKKTSGHKYNPLFYSMLTLVIVIVMRTYCFYNVPLNYNFTVSSINTIFLINFTIVAIFVMIFMAVAIARIMAMKKELEKYAEEDTLTGLVNRRHINEVLENESLDNKQYAVIICDIDNFKKVNDTYGHECGDAVLIAVAKHFKENVRKYDVVSRWGGEEFLIYLKGCQVDDAVVIAEKLRAGIERMQIENRDIRISVSMTFGVSDSAEEDSVQNIIHLADQRLYIGKEAGKNQVVSKKE